MSVKQEVFHERIGSRASYNVPGNVPNISDWSRENIAPLHQWLLQNDLSLESLRDLLAHKVSLSSHAADPRIIVADSLEDIGILQETRAIKALLIAADNQGVVERVRKIDEQGELEGLLFRFTIASDSSGVSVTRTSSSMDIPKFLQSDVFRLAETYMQASGVESAVGSLEHFPDNAAYGLGHFDGTLSSPHVYTNMSFDYLGDGTMLMSERGQGIKPGNEFFNIFRGPSKDTPEECAQFHVQTGGRRLRLLINGQVPVCPQEMYISAVQAGVDIPHNSL